MFQELELANLHQSPTTSQDQGATASKARLGTYRKQLESLRQRLHTNAVRQQEAVHRASHFGEDAAKSLKKSPEIPSLQRSLNELLRELKQLESAIRLDSDADSALMGAPPIGVLNEKILQHNAELTSFVSRLSEEKQELRSTLGRLEEEIWRYRQKEATFTTVSMSTESVTVNMNFKIP